jgi:hypothetical protein
MVQYLPRMTVHSPHPFSSLLLPLLFLPSSPPPLSEGGVVGGESGKLTAIARATRREDEPANTSFRRRHHRR